MKLLKCTGCQWEFIVGRRRVYGPIFEDKSAEAARLMSREVWEDGYTDCKFEEIK